MVNRKCVSYGLRFTTSSDEKAAFFYSPFYDLLTMDTPLEKLKKLAAWETEPELSEDELEELLAAAALVDKAGLHPQHEEWTPTYDLNAAAAAGWLIKAGRASSTTETEPDSFYITSKIFDNCCRMAGIYRAKGRMSLSVTATRD